jgi:hypothetical protein
MKHSEAVQGFRKECSSWYYYQSQIKKADDKLTELQTRIDAVYSPALQKIGSTPSPHEKDLIGLISRQDKIRKEKAYCQEKMHYIKSTIEYIPSPAYRITVWMTLIEGKTYAEVGRKFDVSPRLIKENQEKFLDAVLKKQQNH